ncbi:uncharacterized protein LOC120081420 isoform X1 [Benincasa hispida]|uniref:uncharacterized protein LOC120081420 isoform X1 n=1 Tax=Benincasa hispida TaxID=102211 RepID=UPI0018FF30B0|nr:uncharacterized protein LOC120081420 isoform X1 [Benincasa hispida]
MENKKLQVATSSSSSLDHIFGPVDSNSASSTSTTGYFGSIFPPPVVERARKKDVGNQVSSGELGNPDNASINGKKGTAGANGKDESSIYQNETMEPSYFSSSIFYGGQENYSPRTNASQSHHNFKKEGKDNDANESNSNSVSRGNWWKGMTTSMDLLFDKEEVLMVKTNF